MSCFSNVSDSLVSCQSRSCCCCCCCSCNSLCRCSTVSWRRDIIAVNALTSLSPSSWQWPVVHWHTTGAGRTTQATTTTASSETGHTDVHIAAKLRLTVSSLSNSCVYNVTTHLLVGRQSGYFSLPDQVLDNYTPPVSRSCHIFLNSICSR